MGVSWRGLWVLLIFLSGIVAEAENLHSPFVRLRMTTLRDSAEIWGRGLSVGKGVSSHLRPVSIPLMESLKVKYQRVSGKPVWVIERRGQVQTMASPILEIGASGGSLVFKDKVYPAPLMLVPQERSGNVDVISALRLDDYLRGVLEAEVPSSWPLEAIKAQAIATRSYTLTRMQERWREPYQLDSSVLDQAYKWSDGRHAIYKKALQETQGLVLSRRGFLVKAFYHADCAGHTESSDQVWNMQGRSPLGGVRCPFRGSKGWSLFVSWQELQTRLMDGAPEQKKLLSVRRSQRDLQILSHTPSGRVKMVQFSTQHLTGNELRRRIGFGRLKSTFFSVSKSYEGVTFFGKGQGHGSGLCQWGGRFLAAGGSSARDILSHYYPGTEVTPYDVKNR